MKAKAAFVVGAGIGYLFGTRAGREKFERIKSWADKTWNDPRVKSRVDDLESQASSFAKDQGSALKDKAAEKLRGVRPGGKTDGGSDDDAAGAAAGYGDTVFTEETFVETSTQGWPSTSGTTEPEDPFSAPGPEQGAGWQGEQRPGS